jgi:hypothetical protein
MCRTEERREVAMRRPTGITTLAAAAVVVAAAAFAIGRATAPSAARSAPGTTADYLDGLQVGQARGRLQGRAEQEGAALPSGDRAPVRDAFTAGYTTGMNDAFAGYDGGWTLGVPWIVTLARGTAGIDYRISDRTPLERGIDYFLCPDGRTLCQRPG